MALGLYDKMRPRIDEDSPWNVPVSHNRMGGIMKRGMKLSYKKKLEEEKKRRE
jgi:hypothetical protein